ncbi:MAG TPA: patatin-like phospholipase family protein, partial [Rhizomicrobium sp.]
MASTQSGRDPGGRASFLHSGPYRSWRNAAAGLAVAAILASCAAMEAGFHSKHNETLADLKFTELCAPAGAALAQPAACIDCTASIEQRLRLANGASPQYALEEICDNTDPRLLVIFAFSGGGFRSAAFGFGALQAAHEIDLDRLGPHHPLSREIDIVSGVSGGAFTATAFASRREALFDTHGGRYYGRDFLEHNFMGDLLSVYLEPWRWGWMLPYYGTTDEMASLYGDIPFDDRTALFGENFGTLAVKGRPFLVVQATDFGNEQPFTFTQNDFDLICSNVNAYPVRNAVAAANGFPFLFSPVPLRNFRFPYADESSAACGNREPDWVRASKDYGSYELDRTYERGRIVQGYLPSEKPDSSERRLYLQDGGVTDNHALRGLMKIMGQAQGRPIPAGTKGTDKAGGSDTMVSPPAVPPPAVADDSTACRAGLGR